MRQRIATSVAERRGSELHEALSSRWVRAAAGFATVLSLGCQSEQPGAEPPLAKALGALEGCESVCGSDISLCGEGTSIAGTTWFSETIGTEYGTTGRACYDPATGRFTATSNGQGPDFSPDPGATGPDEMQFVYANLNGIAGVDPRNVEIVVRVVSSELSAGVTIREGNAVCDRMAAGWHTNEMAGLCFGGEPGDISSFVKSERSEPGCVAGHLLPGAGGDTRVKPPYWLRLQRFGDDYALSRRRDGGPWVTLTGGVFKPESEEDVRVGFYAARTKQGGGPEVSATFQNVYVGPARPDYRTSWLASQRAAFSTGFTSFGMDSFYVAPDGTSYKYYADGETNQGYSFDVLDSDGNPQAIPSNAFAGTLQGGITGGGEHLYVSIGNANTLAQTAVSLRAYFRDGLDLHWEIDLETGRIGGLAARGERVYVSDRTHDTVRVFDASTTPPTELSDFAFTNPGPFAVDHRGRLWIAQTPDYPHYKTWNFNLNGASSIECRDPDLAGAPCLKPGTTDPVPTITGLDNPTALAIAPNVDESETPDPADDRLLVALNGQAQNVRIYSGLDTNPTVSETLGVHAGVFAGTTPGLVNDPASGPRFFSPVGVGVDSDGDRYVASSAPSVEIQKFSEGGEPLWNDPPVALGPAPGGFDPESDGTDFYTATRHLKLTLDSNPFATEPGSEWSSEAVTWNPFLAAYAATDKRFNANVPVTQLVAYRGLVGGARPLVRRIGSSPKKLFFFAHADGTVTIYRFEGEIAKPCGALELTASCEGPTGPFCVKLWLDTDGEGDRDETIQSFNRTGGFAYDVDEDGHIWLAAANSNGIYKLPNLGVQVIGGDPNRVIPLYDLAERERVDTPAPFAGITQLQPFVVRFVGGKLYLYGSKAINVEGLQCGAGTRTPVIARYDDWQQGTPSREYALPDPGISHDEPHDFTYLPWDIACGCIDGSCAAKCSFDWWYNSFDVAGDFMFLQEHQGSIHVYDIVTGAEETRMFAGPELSGWQSWADPSDLMSVFRRSNGEYLVTTTDTSRLARTILFRWKPPWTPKRLAPLAWYHAGRVGAGWNTGDVMYDDATGAVVRWHDRSGNGRDLVQSSATHRPIFSATGWNGEQPTVVFDGTTSVLERNPWPTENPIGTEEDYTVLAVVKPAEVRDASIATWWGTGGLVGAWLKADGDDVFLHNLRVGGSSDSHTFTGTTNISTNRRVLAFRYEGGKFKLTVNGSTEESSTLSALSAMTGDRFLVGWQYPGGGTKFKGNISEIVVIPRSISEAEIAEYQAYAEAEWGGFGLQGDVGDACYESEDCASGFCVDDICCRTSCTSDNTCIGNLGCSNVGDDPTDRGVCLGEVLEDGSECDDDDPSTSNDECDDGVCVGGAWTPSSLSPTVWYFASSTYVTDAGGGALSQWSDRSGNGHHVFQSNGCCRPAYSASGWNGNKPTVSFNGTSSVFDTNPWPQLNPIGNEEPYTVLVVMKASSVQHGSLASWWGTGGLVGAWLYADSGSLFLKSRRAGGYGGDYQFTGTTNISTSRHVLAFRYDGAGVFKLTVDATTQTSSNLGTVTPMSGGSGNNQLLLGWQDAWGTTKYQGDLSELVVIPANISDTDVANFRTYAQAEWGGL